MGLVAALIASLVSWSVSADAGPAHLSRGLFQIEYSAADVAVAQHSLEILEKGLAEFSSHLPAGVDPIRVTICHTLGRFKELAGSYAQARVGGVAQSQRGRIIVKAPFLLPSGEDYRGMLRHELIHVLLARNTDPANTPRWFDEGVAMVISREMRWESGMRIARMYVFKRLIPYPELNFAFAPMNDEGLFGDAYAQALSMTEYLERGLGEARFWELVRALKTVSFEEALRTYGNWTPAALYDGWRRSLWKVALITSLVSGFSAFQLMTVLLVIAYLRKRRRGRRILERWEDEEQGPELYTWDELVDGPYSWEEEEDEEEEERR